MGSYSTIPRMTMSDIMKYSYRLGVQCYKEFYGGPLHKDLVEQYRVPRFSGMFWRNVHKMLVMGAMLSVNIEKLQ